MNRKMAKEFIKSLVSLRTSATDPQAIEAPAVYPTWKEGVEYTANNRVLYNGKLYKVLISHISQPDWVPDGSFSLFAEVLIPDEDIIYEWKQPDSTNPYMIGDKVKYEGKIWESIVDNNVWKPGEYGWQEIIQEVNNNVITI